MKNLTAEHLGSGREPQHWPKPTLPEYAFIGRSNVGKSSLLNMLVGQKKLARVSNTPGRTRNVEHFKVFSDELAQGDGWLLADLPGYGFAKISRTERAEWQAMIRRYLQERENLQCVFLLVDVRIEPQRSDLEEMQWLGENGIPFVIVFTKADKLSPPKVASHVATYRKVLLRSWNELPRIFITSSEKFTGRDDLLSFIDEVNAGWGRPGF